MIVREETPLDRGAVYAVVECAFAKRAEADLVEALHRNGDVEISLVADDAGEIVGHILLSRLIAPPRSLALAPLSVAPQRQRQGIGSSLIKVAVERAKQANWNAIFVLGNPRYYTRFGFTIEAAEGFQSPYESEYFMALALKAGVLDARCGPVRYPAPFRDLD